MAEVHGNLQLGYWRTATNRLYYACYFAVSALLVKNGITAHTHAGVLTMPGLHFVKEGKIPFLEPAEKFIVEIESIINANQGLKS